MATFGTREVYDEMARVLNADEKWAEIGKELNYTMVFDYFEPVSKAFFLKFEQGRITDVRELPSADGEPADFVISGSPDTWRAVITKELNPKIALLKGGFKVKGGMGELMKHMKAFSYVLDAMTDIKVV